MDACSVPWAETPPPPSSVDSPAGQRASPDALQVAYNAALGGTSDAQGVIRGPHSPPSHHQEQGDQGLVYQTLGATDAGHSTYFTHPGYGYHLKVHSYQDEPIAGYDQQQERHSPAQYLQYPPLESVSQGTMWSPPPVPPPYLDGGGGTYLLAPSDWTPSPLVSAPSYFTQQEGRRSQYAEAPPEYRSVSVSLPPEVLGSSCGCAICGAPIEQSGWRGADKSGEPLCASCRSRHSVARNSHHHATAASPTTRPQRRLATSRRAGMTCSNCNTTDTTLWRRNTQGEPVCNACGLYYKLHQVNRPISMRKDSIQTRKRKPKSAGSLGKTKNGGGMSSGKSTSVVTYQSLDGASSPILPSSSALCQQLPPFPPLDTPPSAVQTTPPHPSVITPNSNSKQHVG